MFNVYFLFIVNNTIHIILYIAVHIPVLPMYVQMNTHNIIYCSTYTCAPDLCTNEYT